MPTTRYELTRYVGRFAKLVTKKLVLCRCSFLRTANVHFFRKYVAHRVSPKISISGKKLHRRPGLYFLTDPKNIETKKSWTIFGEDKKIQNYDRQFPGKSWNFILEIINIFDFSIFQNFRKIENVNNFNYKFPGFFGNFRS